MIAAQHLELSRKSILLSGILLEKGNMGSALAGTSDTVAQNATVYAMRKTPPDTHRVSPIFREIERSD